MKWTIKPLEDSGLLLKGVTKTVQNVVKEQKGKFLSMLLILKYKNIIKISLDLMVFILEIIHPK